MAKERRVVYTLAIEADPASQKAAADFAKYFGAAELSAQRATKAAKEAVAATRGLSAHSARSMTAGGSSSVNASSTATVNKHRADKQAEREYTRELEVNIRERERLYLREQRAMSDRVRAAVAASKATRAAPLAAGPENDRRRLGIADPSGKTFTDADAKRHVADLGRQYAALDATERQRHAASSKAWKDTGQAVSAATHGLMSYARAMVLLAAADEDSAQRAMQKLAKFQAFADVLNGTIQMVKAGTSAWRAYQAAAAAAAAANMLAEAAGKRGGKGGGGGGGSGTGGIVGGAVAGFAGGALAEHTGGMLRGAGNLAARGAASIGIGAGAGGAVAAGVYAATAAITAATIAFSYSAAQSVARGRTIKEGLADTGNLIVEGMKEFTGLGDMAGDAAKAWKKRWESVTEQLEQSLKGVDQRITGTNERRSYQREIGSYAAGYGLSSFKLDQEKMLSGKGEWFSETNAQPLAEARAALALAERNRAGDQRKLDLAVANRGVGGIAQRYEATELFKSSAAAEFDARGKLLTIEQRIKREQIEAARASITGLQERKRELEQILKEEEKAGQSAAARFGSMTDSEQQQVIAAGKAHKEGKLLNRESEDLLGGLGGGASDIADASRSNRAYATPGFKEFVADQFFTPKITAARGAVRDVTANITNEFKITIAASSDHDKLGKLFVEKIIPLLKLSDENAAKALDEVMRRDDVMKQLKDAQGGSQ